LPLSLFCPPSEFSMPPSVTSGKIENLAQNLGVSAEFVRKFGRLGCQSVLGRRANPCGGSGYAVDWRIESLRHPVEGFRPGA
jgi:predicted PP-loop superfamily ATPase